LQEERYKNLREENERQKLDSFPPLDLRIQQQQTQPKPVVLHPSPWKIQQQEQQHEKIQQQQQHEKIQQQQLEKIENDAIRLSTEQVYDLLTMTFLL
jgi:hypothetical protein